jgi:hypothetical protein
MSRLRKKIEDAFAAAAFAEAGEFETAKEIARGSKKVLLVLTGGASDEKSFTYAVNVAGRTGSSLEVILFSSRKLDNETLGHFQEKASQKGVGFHMNRVGGCLKTEILKRTTRQSNIQFVVAESIEALSVECQDEGRSLRGALKKLRCPLVLVSPAEHEG